LGHPDNVLSLTREMNKELDVTLVFVVSGMQFTEGVLDLNLTSLQYGLNTNIQHNLEILPYHIRKYLGEGFQLYFLRTPDLKILKDKKLRNFRYIRNAIKKLKKENFDVVHFNGTSGFLLYFVPMLRKYPKIWTLHDFKAHTGEKNIQAFLINRFVSKFKFHFIQHYRYLRNQLIQHYRLPAHKVHTLYSGSLDVIADFPETPIPGLSSDYILFFGRISQYKGVDTLLQAYTQLEKNASVPKLVIAGNGNFWFDTTPYEQDPDIKIINRYVSSSELVYLIRHSQYIVTPYKDATHSAVIATAYAFNKPVLATNVDGLSEVVLPNETGLLVNPNNPDALKEGMQKMNRDPNIIDSYSENIMNLRKDGKLSWKRIIQDYINVYQKALTN
jgi:glycosyltransferase involved in cell wall biosynthesis